MKPTQLLLNGRIYDLHGSASVHDAMALDGPTILAVGSNDDILKFRHTDTSIIDLQQASVIPGITDSHIHLQLYALTLDQVDCETDTRQECLARVHGKARNTPRGTWIRGHGWNQNQWGRFGTREELDAVAPDHPVYLTAKSLHAGWANSMALQFAGVTRETGDPPRGKLGRTPDGELDGIFFEDAMRLISEKIPPASVDQVTSALLHTQDKLLEMGITSVHDFDGPICFAALNRLRQAGQLKLRVVKHFRRESLQPMIDLGLATGVGDYHLRIGNLKLFADGALGPQTAAMLEPYQGTKGDMGMLTEDEAEILEIGRKASEYGIALAVHAIGDRANRTVLNALEKLIHERERTGCPALRHRMEHLQLLNSEDLSRPGNLGIVASMQPVHAISDMDMAIQKWGARVKTSYAWKSQLTAGAKLIFGSDAPVESPNPFIGIHAAISRRKLDGSPGPDGWIPKERLTLQEALTAYTSTPHEAAGWASKLGRLQPGFLADLVVINEPVLEEIREWWRIRPVGVMANGEWIVPLNG